MSRSPQCFAELADRIRDDLVADVPWTHTLRLIIDVSDEFARLDTKLEQERFLAPEPAPTTDVRYDALLAGLAVHLARTAQLSRAPSWTQQPERFLPSFWWYGYAADNPGLRAYAWQRTPSCMRGRGVVFNIDNLASL